MSPAEVCGEKATSHESAGKVRFKIEAVVIPVSDVDRAKAFYGPNQEDACPRSTSTRRPPRRPSSS
jgi:hypothetical protein